MGLEFAARVSPPTGADVVRVEGGPRAVRAVLADGAGGQSGGRATAEWVVDFVWRALEERRPTLDSIHGIVLEAALEAERRDAGQTTLIVARVTPNRVVGVSVGDSEARIGRRALTEGQTRKPLLGGGMPRLHTFDVGFTRDDLLIIGCDGLWKYAAGPLIAPPLDASLHAAAGAFIDSARLPNGTLQDDASVILIRDNPRPPPEVLEELQRRLEDETARRAPAPRALEEWVETFNPQSDGALADSFERVGDTLVVRGRDCDVTTQRWQPWLLHWTPAAWELCSGIAGFADGTIERRRFDFDLDSEWVARLRWP